MLSQPSFKTELQRYQAKNTADRDLIARWQADDRFEKLWKSIRAAKGDLPPADLIKFVLQARRSAQASVNRVHGANWKGGRLPGFNEAWANVKKDLVAKLAVATALGAATLLDRAAQEVRDLHCFYFGFSDHLGLPEGPKFELSRKDQSGALVSRVRKLFIQICAGWFTKMLGRPFDEAVAALTEIAFPGPELQAEGVIGARKIRPAARQSTR
jgi:hypothetical protein